MKSTITLSQKERWMAYLNRSAAYDFYQTWTYHSLDKSDGTALLFVYEEGADFIAVPLLKRAIPDSDFYDLGCVYGYSGPFCNKDFSVLDQQFVLQFKASFLEFFKEERIITVFLRLHPFFNQDLLMNHFGGVFDNGKVVVMDLTVPFEVQKANYQERINRKIRQLKQRGYFVKEGGTITDIRTFISIYTANMLRLDAAENYFFNEDYFTRLLGSDEFDARLLFVYNQCGYPVCGAVIVLTNQLIQAHLLGTREEYLTDSPAKLLVDEITVLGRRMGMKYYNLGGGLGFKEDSLLSWKMNFSALTMNYQSWRFIADPEEYNRILDHREIDRNLDIDFFPLYRMAR